MTNKKMKTKNSRALDQSYAYFKIYINTNALIMYSLLSSRNYVHFNIHMTKNIMP